MCDSFGGCLLTQEHARKGCPKGFEPLPPGSQPGMQRPLHHGHRARSARKERVERRKEKGAELRPHPSFNLIPYRAAPSTGFEPAISCVTGRRALQAAPRGRMFLFAIQRPGTGSFCVVGGAERACPPRAACPLAQPLASVASSSGGIRTHSIPDSESRWSASCLPSHVSAK